MMTPASKSGWTPVPPSSAGTRNQCEPQTGQGSGEAGGSLTDTHYRVRRGGEPVVEDRLLEPIGVVEMRCKPVTRLDHLPRTLGVKALVGVGNGRCAQAGEQRQEAYAYQRKRVPLHVSEILSLY